MAWDPQNPLGIKQVHFDELDDLTKQMLVSAMHPDHYLASLKKKDKAPKRAFHRCRSRSSSNGPALTKPPPPAAKAAPTAASAATASLARKRAHTGSPAASPASSVPGVGADSSSSTANAVSSDDGSSGALKRALSEEEAIEVAAAWEYPEESEDVVCSLPMGDGESSVDILGKHMAR
jgi:hypothetical protein